MYKMSEAFSEAIKAPARQTTSVVLVELNTKAEALTATIQDSSGIREVNSLTKGFLSPSENIYTGEHCPSFLLDGFSITNSNDVSDAQGNFLQPVVVTVNYKNVHKCNNVILAGNPHDLVKEVTIKFFKGVTQVHELTKTIAMARDGVQGFNVECDKIELHIKSTHLPERPVTLYYFGSVSSIIFENNDYSDLTVLEALGSDDLLPYSPVSANEATYSLDNIDSFFTPSNKLSPLYGLMKPGSATYIYTGCAVGNGEYEMVPMGEYFITEWSAPNSSPYSDITAHDRMYDIMDNDLPLLRTVHNESIASLFRRIMVALNVPYDKYKINVNKTVQITFGFQIGSKVRDAFNAICEAGVCYITCDRNGIITLQDFELGTAALVMKDDDYILNVNNLERFDTIINKLNITIYEPSLWRDDRTLSEFAIIVDPGRSVIDDITFSNSPVVLLNSVSLLNTSKVKIAQVDYGHDRLRLTLDNTDAAALTVNVNASATYIKFIERTRSVDGNPMSRTSLKINNKLVQTTAHADLIASLLLNAITDPFSLFDISSRGNPALQPGDIIELSAPAAGVYNEVVEIRSGKYNFDGALTCDYTARRVLYD